MKITTKGVLITVASVMVIGVSGTLLVKYIKLRREKKRGVVHEGDTHPCIDADFWDGYYYSNPKVGEDGHISSRPLGDKILVYRKDYKKMNNQWVWVNPLDKKDIDTTLDSKSIDALEKEMACRQGAPTEG